MSFQYTYDAQGKPIGVFIPINEWEQLKFEIKKIGVQNNKASIFKSIRKGLNEVDQIQKGKLKAISIKQLLDEL